MQDTVDILKRVGSHSNAGDKVLKVFEKLKKKEIAQAKPSSTSSASMEGGVEPTGTPEMQELDKKEYGFDWQTSKGLDVDEYRPGG